MGKAVEFRVLGPANIEDFHAHLVRLDRFSRFPGTDDRAIDAHCLDLIGSGAILIGAFVDGVMRAAAEIIPDRTARRAQASITVESAWQDHGYERELVARVIDEARRYHLHDLRVNEQNTIRSYRLPPFELKLYAANG
jgi:GNAT superfamily N-acetyltransferase